MHLLLLAVGKTDSRAIEELTKLYADRLGHYLPFTLQIIPRYPPLQQAHPRAAEADGGSGDPAPDQYVG